MNEFHNMGSSHGSGEAVISLVDVIQFFATRWKLILGAGLAGAVAAVSYSIWLPQQFQSHVLLVVAERPEVIIGDASQGNHITIYRPTRDIESPELLLARMRIPTTYPSAVVTGCQFSSQTDLLRALRNFSADIQKATFGFSVQHRSPELATQCAEALFKMIQSQQAELATTIIERFGSRSARVQVMLPGAPARLAAPIYAADEPVSPQKRRLVAAWFAGGLFAGLLVAMLWSMVTWYLRKAASDSLSIK